jgi:hypothetical protein
MTYAEFNDMLWEAYPWEGEKCDYLLKCPALDISFDNGGQCRQCRTFTVDIMNYPTKNAVFMVTYELLAPKRRICSRQCLYNYMEEHMSEILEKITA